MPSQQAASQINTLSKFNPGQLLQLIDTRAASSRWAARSVLTNRNVYLLLGMSTDDEDRQYWRYKRYKVYSYLSKKIEYIPSTFFELYSS